MKIHTPNGAGEAMPAPTKLPYFSDMKDMFKHFMSCAKEAKTYNSSKEVEVGKKNFYKMRSLVFIERNKPESVGTTNWILKEKASGDNEDSVEVWYRCSFGKINSIRFVKTEAVKTKY